MLPVKRTNMMKRAFILTVLLFAILPPVAQADNAGTDNAGPGFKVARLVLARSIEDREPVGIANVFSKTDDQVYCFLEAKDVTKNTHVDFIWYYKGVETARIELPVRKSSRWRTYSSKKFGVRTGQWRVDLVDADGNVLESLSFEVHSE
jgi:hypothetical protein